MKPIQRIAKNTFFLLASNIIQFFLSFIFLTKTTRYLGSEEYGVLSFAIAFASIVIFLADLGISTVMVRDIARDKTIAPKYFSNSILLKLILSVVTLLSTALIGFAFNYPFATMQIVYVITLSLIFVSFYGIIGSIIQAFEVMEYLSLGNVIYNVVMLICALLAIHLGVDVLGFAYVYLISSIIVAGYYFVIAMRKLPWPKWHIDLDLWKYLVKEAIPFGLSTIFIRVYYYIDTLMISLMIADPNAVMGCYNAAYRMVLILSFIPITFLGSVYPIMSKYYVTSDKYLGLIFERSFKYLMALAIPIGVGTTLLGDQLVFLVYGPDYASSAIALKILVWSEVLIFLSAVFGNLLNSTNRQVIVTRQTMFAAALNIVLNLFLIPKYSYIGASISTVSTELFSFFFLLYCVTKEGYRLPKNMLFNFFRVIIACSAMALFIRLFSSIATLPLIFMASVVYLVAMLFTGVMDNVDIQMARQLIGGAKSHDRRKGT